MEKEDMDKALKHIIENPKAEFSLFGKMFKRVCNLEAELNSLQKTTLNRELTPCQHEYNHYINEHGETVAVCDKCMNAYF